MSKRFEFERFDVRGCACDECDTGVTPRAEFDGEWVKAQDALDREAVLQAQIARLDYLWNDAEKRARLLQRQLDQLEGFKVKLQPLLEDKARLDSGCIMTNDHDEFGDGYVRCERRGIDLRAAIDAAMNEVRKSSDG